MLAGLLFDGLFLGFAQTPQKRKTKRKQHKEAGGEKPKKKKKKKKATEANQTKSREVRMKAKPTDS